MRRLKLLSVLFFSSIILSACSSPFDQLADEMNSWFGSDSSNSSEETADDENAAEESDTADSEESSEKGETSETAEPQEEVETIDYSHLMNQGEEVTLDEGVHTVGNDIKPGRYVVTSNSGYGSVFITDEEDMRFIGETIEGETDSSEDQVTQFVAFLDEDDSVEIEYVESMTFTPYETASVDTIFPGEWVVGQDFPAGVYDVSLPEMEASGALEVTAHPQYNKSAHTLGSEQYGGMTEFTMSFEDGDIVELRRVPEVTLTER